MLRLRLLRARELLLSKKRPNYSKIRPDSNRCLGGSGLPPTWDSWWRCRVGAKRQHSSQALPHLRRWRASALLSAPGWRHSWAFLSAQWPRPALRGRSLSSLRTPRAIKSAASSLSSPDHSDMPLSNPAALSNVENRQARTRTLLPKHALPIELEFVDRAADVIQSRMLCTLVVRFFEA